MSEITIYGLKTCDTCRKAARTLTSAGHVVVLHDVRADPLPETVLADWLAQFGPDLVNRKSTTWRGLSEDDRARAPADLLAAHPALMKRPVIAADGAVHLGWTAPVRTALGV
jgi:arsenate reductase-like glutaredoxin family protein